VLVRDDASGLRRARIDEVEAYGGPDDAASHARSGLTARNAAMFGPPGHAYVYLVYGMHDCLNVVTGAAGAASAVLIRAVTPIDGVDLMRASRLTTAGRRRAARTAEGRERAAATLARTPDDRLASGPGLVAASFGLDTTWSGVDLCVPGSVLRLELGDDVPDDRIVAGPRVGIDHAGAPAVGRPWRLWLADSAAVSGRSDARSG
jgi:DNA-3-methyladenine glycosylase